MKKWIATAVLGISAAFFGMGETAQADHNSHGGSRFSSGYRSSYHGGHSYNRGYRSGYGFRIQPVFPRHGHHHHGHHFHGHHGHQSHGHHGHHNYNRYGSRFQLRFSF